MTVLVGFLLLWLHADTADDVCGEPAKTMGWWEPHWQHTAVIDLMSAQTEPVAMYYYQVTGCGWSSVISSFRPPNVGHQHTLTAVLTADMGATTPDRISQRESLPSAATYFFCFITCAPPWSRCNFPLSLQCMMLPDCRLGRGRCLPDYCQHGIAC